MSIINVPAGYIQPYKLYKTTVWKRMDNDEVEAVRSAKVLQPERFQAIWEDAVMIDSADAEFFPALRQFLADVLNADRADELLSPERV